jgi:hypothetical protein
MKYRQAPHNSRRKFRISPRGRGAHDRPFLLTSRRLNVLSSCRRMSLPGRPQPDVDRRAWSTIKRRLRAAVDPFRSVAAAHRSRRLRRYNGRCSPSRRRWGQRREFSESEPVSNGKRGVIVGLRHTAREKGVARKKPMGLVD